MKTLILNFPTKLKAKEFFNFINECLDLDLAGYGKIIFDFQNIGFCKPAHLVALACLIEKMKLNHPTHEIGFQGGTAKFNSYLNDIKFKDYWNPGFDRDTFTPAKNNTTLCLWHISKTMIESYGDQAQRYFKRNFFNDKDLQPLSYSLKEIFNNIFDHANSNIQGYVLTQYYPNLKKLSFSICDFGVGIGSSVNNYLKIKGEEILEDSDAIIKSLEQGFSIQSTPQNRGLGLNTVKDFSDLSGGRLLIVSNTGVVLKYHDEKFKKYDFQGFKGTLISVEIDTEKFDEFDNEEEIYEL